MPDPLSVGVIGGGEIAHNDHLPAFADHDRVSLTALAELDPDVRKSTQEEYGIQNGYEDGRTLLEEESLDLVSICTPVTTHEEFFTMAAERGCAIYCEKPFAPTLESATRMADAAEENEVIVQIGYKYRLSKNFERALRLSKNNILGRTRALNIVFQSFPSRKAWYTDKEFPGGGVVMEIFAHHLDFCLELFESKPEVKEASVDSILTNSVEDYAEITLDFDGVSVTAILGQTQETYAIHKNHLIGTAGSAEFNMQDLSTHLRNDYEYRFGEPPTIDYSFKKWWFGASDNYGRRRITDFVDHVVNGDPDTSAPVNRGVEVARITEAIYEAAGITG